MYKLGSLIVILMICAICKGQNLITNGDFEQYSGCPSSFSQIDSAISWFNPTVGQGVGGTPDYYNICHTGPLVGVPTNNSGYQAAHSGVAYAGLSCAYISPYPDYREYIETGLTTPLVANSCYYFTMYVSLADESKMTTDDIGIYFSDTLISGITNFNALPYVPQLINTTGFITNTVGWTLVSGYYTALGGESFLIIGNFNDSANTTVQVVNSSVAGPPYFYVDDVTLTVCTSLEEQNLNAEIKIYPNPVNDKISISSTGNELVEFVLYDISARKIISQSFINSTFINSSQLAKGLYVYEVRNANRVIMKGKILRN